jgi:hypothetical protein
VLSRIVSLKKWRRGMLPAYLIVCCSILPLQSWLDGAAYSHSSGSRRLVIVLDGVPYQTIAELRAEGRFRRFNAPARMISMFPSLTNVAMIEILQAGDSPGYEDHYYDRERNRILGTIQDRLQGGKFIRGTFRETFDYHAPAFKGAMAYLAAPAGTIAVAHLDLSAFRKAFRESDAPLFVAYIGETDSLTHLGGKKMLKSLLRALDRTVEELISESEGRLEVEMFSDHGNNYADYTSVELNDAINGAGFKTEKSLISPNSVVLPKYGLVGASTLFTSPENRARLAEVCAKTKGVDFAVYQSGKDVIELISVRGRARVAQRRSLPVRRRGRRSARTRSDHRGVEIARGDRRRWLRFARRLVAGDYAPSLRRSAAPPFRRLQQVRQEPRRRDRQLRRRVYVGKPVFEPLCANGRHAWQPVARRDRRIRHVDAAGVGRSGSRLRIEPPFRSRQEAQGWNLFQRRRPLPTWPCDGEDGRRRRVRHKRRSLTPWDSPPLATP